MKNRGLLILAGVFIALGVRAQTNIVTNTYFINPGLNAIVNQANVGSNTLGDVIGYNVPDQTVVYFYSPNMGYYDFVTFFVGFGWFDNNDGGATTNGPVLPPGVGVFLSNPGTNFQFTAVGRGNVPTLPLNLNCGSAYFIGRQTNGIGTFGNVVGSAAQDGDQIYVYQGVGQSAPPAALDSSFATHTFSGGGWVPNEPYLNPGQAAFFRRSCSSNACISMLVSNIYLTSSTPVPVSFTPIVSDFCGGAIHPFTVYSRPPSGSLFFPGMTPVHCVAVDDLGNTVGATFNVQIAPAPLPSPTNSYTVNLTSGLNLIAYQFDNGGNTLREIMTNVPDGTVATKYLNGTTNWLQSTYNASLNAWIPANITVKPGDGLFLMNTNITNLPLILTGHPHLPHLPSPLTNAIELVSRQTNGVGNFTNIVGAAPLNGTKIFQLRAGGGGYDTFTFTAGAWSPFEPSNRVGQAWWISRPGGPSQPPAIPIAPTITQQPSSVQTSSGNPADFSVMASGDTPLSYQWRLNGSILAGQTNAALSIGFAQSTNCGSYDVVVQNQIGIVKSTNVSITLLDLFPLGFSDNFANAGAISGPSGSGTGANTNATLETGEPSAGFIPGGASVWVQWLAPNDGVATFSTAGSDFDTLLGIYTGAAVTNLTRVAADDDSAGFLCSQAQFNALAGVTYYIQVDGFYGITGNIILNWNLFPTEEKLPVILVQPQSQTLAQNSNVQFTVTTPAGSDVTYQWLRNGNPIVGATNNFYVTNANFATVGFYQVIVSNLNGDGLATLSQPADLQVNIPAAGTPVNSRAHAESKLTAVQDTTVRPNDPYDPPIVTGYSGVEVFSMYDATQENPEPLHCGVTCYFTKWHSYMAPSNGLLSVSDFGTTFGGVMGIYSGPDFTLTPLACSGGHPAGTEVVAFMAQAGSNYWISVSATNANTNGTVQLQYSTLAPPFYTLLPVTQTVGLGSNLTLTVATTGNPAVSYQWQTNGVNIPGATGANLTVNPFGQPNQGNYTVIAKNTVGTNIFIYAPIYLNNPPVFIFPTNVFYTNSLYVQLMGMANTNYLYATSPDMVTWTTNGSIGSSATGVINFSNTINKLAPAKFYKAILPYIP